MKKIYKKNILRTSVLLFTLCLNFNLFAQYEEKASYYQNRYQLNDLITHLVNNTGDGFEELYGTRNFRVLLNGILYRGGGNNYYHRTNKRNNINPLPNDGLQNLCSEGFDTAIYLYYTRFDTAPKTTNCINRKNQNTGKLDYKNLPPFSLHQSKGPNQEIQINEENIKDILRLVYQKIHDESGPIYIHCWNGWHASGYISALSLMQFCSMDHQTAVKYWDQATDGRNQESRYEKIRNLIRKFKPYKEFEIPKEIQDKICLKY